jgi:holo-[acyl-carrier protein] synthase
MKILGIGVDIIENKRIKKSIKKFKFKKEFIAHKELN